MFKHLLSISPRASRAELIFWGVIFQIITCIYIFLQYSIPVSPADFSFSTIPVIFLLLILMPICLVVGWMWIALLVRRLHDINLSGWWILALFALGFVTLFMPPWFAYVARVIGLGFMAYLAFMPATATTNKYGEAPSKTYAPAFFTNKNNLTISAVLFLILFFGFQLYYTYGSQKRLQEIQQMQEQYLQQISATQGNI